MDACEQQLFVTNEPTSSRLNLPKEHFTLLLKCPGQNLASFLICNPTLCLDDSFQSTDGCDSLRWQRTRPNLLAPHHLITEITSNYTPAIFDHLHHKGYVRDGCCEGSLSLWQQIMIRFMTHEGLGDTEASQDLTAPPNFLLSKYCQNVYGGLPARKQLKLTLGQKETYIHM